MDCTEAICQDPNFEKRATEILELIAANELLEPILLRITSLLCRQCDGGSAILLAKNGQLQVVAATAVSQTLRSRLPELFGADPLKMADLDSDSASKIVGERLSQADSYRLPSGDPIVSVAAWPLRESEGAVMGWVLLLSGAAFTLKQHAAVLHRGAHLAFLALQHRRLQERLSLEARRDPITGLPNRLLLSELLEQTSLQSKRDGSSFALLAIQLQPFQQIVDTYGHAAGDILLKSAAERLGKLFSSEHTVARLSGGTFVVLWHGVPDRGAAEARAGIVLRAFEEPFSFFDHTRQITVSIGIGLFPEDGSAAGELLRDIIAAMRQNSKPGRSSIQAFAFEAASAIGKRLHIAKHLGAAAERGEFHLVYQPQVNLQRQVVAMETLLRWTNPELGHISPATFIPVAEESGLIFAIDSWVLRHALQQAHQWQRSGKAVRVAINISAAQFASPEFVDFVRRVLRETGVDPQLVELEITEGVMMHSTDLAIGQINRLRSLGVRTAIDDFGAGYSSLSYLRMLPVHCVKIDRSFLEELHSSMNALAILEAVIELSHQLGLEVILEGVETEEQLQLLTPLRPDLLQGFFFHRPLPPEQAESLLTGSRKRPRFDFAPENPAGRPSQQNLLRS